MTVFEIEGIEYRIEKLDARSQLHVVRRIGPLLTPLAAVVAMAAKASGDARGTVQRLLSSPELITELLERIAELPDEQLDYVIDKCLAVVRRKAAGGDAWVPVWNVHAKRTNAEEENDLARMLQLTVRVITESLSGFFSGLPTGLLEKTGALTA